MTQTRKQRGGVRSVSLLKKTKSRRRTQTRAAFTGYANELFQFIILTKMDWKTSGLTFADYLKRLSAFLKTSVRRYNKTFLGKASIRTEMELMFVAVLDAVSPVLQELLDKRDTVNSQDEGFFDVEALRVLEDYRTILYGDVTAAVARVKALYKFLDEYLSLLADYRGDEDFELEADNFSLGILNATVPPIHEAGAKLMPMLSKKRTTMSVLRVKPRKPKTLKNTKALPTILENANIDDLAELLSGTRLAPK